MGEAADIGGGDDRRRSRFQRLHLVREKALRKVLLQKRVGSRRAAAQVRIGNRRQVVTQVAQDRLDEPGDLEAVLEGAGGVERGAGWRVEGRRWKELCQVCTFRGNDLRDVLCKRGYARVLRIASA